MARPRKKGSVKLTLSLSDHACLPAWLFGSQLADAECRSARRASMLGAESAKALGLDHSQATEYSPDHLYPMTVQLDNASGGLKRRSDVCRP